jgi:hypothetical protein
VFFIATVSFADIVVFKSGKELTVEKTWQEGEQICFQFHGVKAAIPISKIVRIESESAEGNHSFTQRNQTPSDSKGSLPDRTGDVDQSAPISSGQTIPREACTTLRKDGFCDLQWGTKVSSVDGLKKNQTISDLDDVVEYVRQNDILKIGDAKLKSINYAFWRDQLYTVTFWTKGHKNFTALRDEVFKEFGQGRQVNSNTERYLWSDTVSDIMLEYIKDGSYGMLWLRSKELDSQCKSSRVKSHVSYLKWMNSRN